MKSIELVTDLTGAVSFNIPPDVAMRLPKTGKARIIVLTGDSADTEWYLGAYQQFQRDD